MSILGKLFGTTDAVNTTIETVGRVVDDFVYTDEEEAGDKMRAQTEGREFLIRWLESTSGSRLARRVIALTVTFSWVMMFFIGAGLDIASVWAIESAEKLAQSSKLLDARAGQMNGAVMLILGFYFAAPHLGDIAKGALEKFGGNK